MSDAAWETFGPLLSDEQSSGPSSTTPASRISSTIW
jgi:hypothetical protein